MPSRAACIVQFSDYLDVQEDDLGDGLDGQEDDLDVGDLLGKEDDVYGQEVDLDGQEDDLGVGENWYWNALGKGWPLGSGL